MSSFAVRALCLFPLLIGSLGASAVPEGRVEIPVQAGGNFSVPVFSMKEQRFQKTIHQQYDFSCGSAALATLLTHHYNYPVSEQEVFREMFARGDQAKIKKEGFSLLDIKNYLATRGFEADGYVAELDKLSVAGIPAIALVKEQRLLPFRGRQGAAQWSGSDWRPVFRNSGHSEKSNSRKFGPTRFCS